MAKRIVFFNNKGGVGKTTMVYHIAYMLRELGHKVLVADFDPQTNLTAMFLEQKRLEEIFLGSHEMLTITDMMRPVIEGEGYKGIYVEPIYDGLFGTDLHLLLGNLSLSAYEDKLSGSWAACVDRDAYSFKVISLFHKIMADAVEQTKADFVLIDVGPNLGAINRAVLIASDYVVSPVGSDLFSLQGIKNLGITLKNWREEWSDRKNRNPKPTEILLPEGKMQPIGYIATQHTSKENRPVNAYLRWSNRIPQTYKEYILGQPNNDLLEVEQDVNCLGMIRHYHSLMPMAMEAKKPIFMLKPADGAIGAHFQATKKVFGDFETVTNHIISACQ